jgi:Flp pilus assembly protein TadG
MMSALMLSLLLLAALLFLAASDAANVLMARARVQNAADAAALAAASAQWRLASETGDPADAARRVAEANDATLESCECALRSDRSRVTVSRATSVRMLGVAPRRVSATAEARADVGRLFVPR